MKTITINVSEVVYDEFRRASQSQGRPASELIREAMEMYRRERLRRGGDLSQFRPVSVGRVLEPLTNEDDLLSEMMEEDS